MKNFILCFVLCLVLGGCGKKDYTHFYKHSTDSYEIQSYKEITEQERKLIADAFSYTMEYLKQDKVKDTFVIKLFYNDVAFQIFFSPDQSESIFTKMGKIVGVTFWNRSPVEIGILISNLNQSVVGHEMVHAIRSVNDLVFSDSESIAEIVEDHLDAMYWAEIYTITDVAEIIPEEIKR